MLPKHVNKLGHRGYKLAGRPTIGRDGMCLRFPNKLLLAKILIHGKGLQGHPWYNPVW